MAALGLACRVTVRPVAAAPDRPVQVLAGGETAHIAGRSRRAGVHCFGTYREDGDMSKRIASLARRIEKNGAMLHRAMVDRIHALGVDHDPSEAEQALAEERRLLKEERTNRRARAQC